MYAKLIPRFSRLEEVFKPNLSTNPEDSDELTKKKILLDSDHIVLV